GCGKTTLLRMIAGLDNPDEGLIRIGDRIVNNLPPNQRRISMVFQSYALYPHMTVRKNIAFPLRTEHLSPSEIDQKVVHAAELFNIERFLERKPSQLSGGERQRVALARAIVREPDAFLLDEPLSNLDVALRGIARAELKQFQRKLGVTTIFVTHDQVDAMSMGDRIAVMADGRIRQIGTAQELYHRPADTFVATFLGSPPMNLVEKDSCILGFHPEDFIPASHAQEEVDTLTIPFRVSRVEYLGVRRVLYGHIDSLSGRVEAISTLPAGDQTEINPGKVYDFIVARARLTYFNRHTQLRMEMTPFTHEGVIFD
ncbi:MAG: ABC transporter ATP-binding protein, partial [Anaerolineae bacterium]|nr:ABC transporter ATP-binding protein [Anaerolineae bacterium]